MLRNLTVKKDNRFDALIAKNLLQSPHVSNVITAAPVFSTKERDIKMPPVKELRKKYEEFKNHSQIYESAFEAYWFIGKVFSSTEFNGYKNKYFGDFTTELGASLNNRDDNFYHLDLQGKVTETRISLDPLRINLSYAKDPETVRDMERIIKAYFPSFKLPTSWTRINVQEEDQGGSGSLTRKAISAGPDLNIMLPLEKIVNIKPEFTSPDPKDDVKTFKLPKSYFQKNFNGIAHLNLTLKQSDISLGRAVFGFGTTTDTEGSLVNSSSSFSIPVEAELILKWPTEFAYYATCSASSKDFIPFLFYQYVTWHRMAYGGGRTRGGGLTIKPPSRINHLGNILDRNETERKAGRNVKPRTNEDGFLILGVGEPSKTGDVYWIPENMNKVGEYLQQIKSAYNPNTKKMELFNIKLKGEGLLTDWYNEKYTYFRETGVAGRGAADISGIHTIDLTGSVPLDGVTIHKSLDEDLRDSKSFEHFLSLLSKFEKGDYKAKPEKSFTERAKEIGLDVEELNARGTTFGDFCLNAINRNKDKVTWANIGGKPLYDEAAFGGDIISEEEEPEKFVRIRAACNLIKAISQDVMSKLDDVDVGYVNKLENLRYTLFLINKYAGKYKEYQDQFQNKIKTNSVPAIPDAAFEAAKNQIRLPNLQGINQLMPHQLETAIQSRIIDPKDQVPEASLTEVSAGGGKTAIELIEIANLLLDKKINRPLVIVPGNLVRNWVNEINFFSKGNINAFAITIQSLRRMQYAYTKNPDPVQKPDYAMLKKVIESMPPNTVFVTSYRFLINDREDIVYGNKIITRLYCAEFLRDVGFDLSAIDESHYAKNLDSLQTLGVSIVESASKIKRGLSGTTVIDTLTDLVGQAGVMVPPALGNTSQFMEKYAAGENGSKTKGEWLPDAPKLITDDMRPYIQRIVHKRQKWAAMLPFLNEEFHPVTMTEKQAEFYKDLLERQLEQLKQKNPKLYAKLLDGNEKDTKAIEQGLNTYFQALEEFIYAPDSNEAFLQVAGLSDEDKVSPKVEKVVDILDKHFGGFKDVLGVKHEASPHKVIIFSHRRETSKHFMRHLPDRYKKIAIRYEAGDFKALQAFLKDDRVKIIVADELSINTGQNFQLASRMIRLETLWSPGSQEQAIARIWRPAFKEGSDRPEIFMDWIFTNRSLEVAKIGRLISKIIMKTKYDQQDNPRFTKDLFVAKPGFVSRFGNVIPQVASKLPVDRMLGNLRLIKMNNETLKNLNDRSQLVDYFAYYALINEWEVQEFNELKKSKRYSQMIDLPKTAYMEIKDSRKVSFSPRVAGVEPTFVDPEDKMGYKPISVIENEMDLEEDDDDESIKTKEINPVDIGQLVDTEFGFGTVTKILQTDIWVDVKGIGEIKVPKATAWIVGNKSAARIVQEKLKAAGKKGLPRLPGPVVAAMGRLAKEETPINRRDDDDDENVVDQKVKPGQKEPKTRYDEYDADVADKDSELDVWGEIIDGQIALTCYAEDEDSDFLVETHGFMSLDPYIAIRIPNIKIYRQVMKHLQDKFSIADKYIENFEYYETLLANKTLTAAKPNAIAQTMRFFGVEQHKKIKEGWLRPYPIVWGSGEGAKFFIAFDRDKTASSRKAIAEVKKLALPGVKVVVEDSIHLKFFKSADEAIDLLDDISDTVTIPNKDETIDFLKSIKRKSAPKKVVEEDEDEDEEDETPSSPTKKTGNRFSFRSNKPEGVKVNVKPKTPIKAPAASGKTRVTVEPEKSSKKPSFKLNLKRGYTKVR